MLVDPDGEDWKTVLQKTWEDIKHVGSGLADQYRFLGSVLSENKGFSFSRISYSDINNIGKNVTLGYALGAAEEGMLGAASGTEELGSFARVSESMSARAAEYQSAVTGLPADVGYIVDGVKFDGYSNGVLLDAKGPGYANFVKGDQFASWFKGADSLVSQAQRQVAAAGDTPIEWHVAEKSAAKAIKNLLKENKIKGISVIYDKTPAQ